MFYKFLVHLCFCLLQQVCGVVILLTTVIMQAILLMFVSFLVIRVKFQLSVLCS
jgi:hypothetical protein